MLYLKIPGQQKKKVMGSVVGVISWIGFKVEMMKVVVV